MNHKRIVSPEEKFPKVPESLFLFRSCTGSVEYPGTENAIKEILKLLGIKAVMDPDQTCCSGYLLTCSAYKPEFSLAVTARNLSLAERKDLDVFAFCNGCFGYLSELAHIILHNPDYKAMANSVIAPMGYEFKGTARIYHVQELYRRLQSNLVALVKRPLQGLRVGVHYGCHYLARQYGILDDGGYPSYIEDIISSLGGTPVFYKERQACCGYAVGRGFTHKENVVHPHLYSKLKSAREEGVEILVTVCPGCNTALDREQPALSERSGEKFGIPAIDVGQLIALALGVAVQKLGFKANTVPLDEVLRKISADKGENIQ
ncbi:MAG: CoB--CoM heterodisulfide reductase iron-sulfur subunit B family protein [Desulfovibrionaceae bacterium]|nr:CoB--CoM heterodisulfide reductase iron-sulfur subunit B family protein [Desulfovibrionaceae bacterium]